jgi:hypothetical protein
VDYRLSASRGVRPQVSLRASRQRPFLDRTLAYRKASASPGLSFARRCGPAVSALVMTALRGIMASPGALVGGPPRKVRRGPPAMCCAMLSPLGLVRVSKGKCGRLSPLLHFTLRVCLERGHRSVQTIHQFNGRRWRERQAMGDLDHGFLTLCWLPSTRPPIGGPLFLASANPAPCPASSSNMRQKKPR